MSLLKRLWRGELSLPITFWLYGVFGLVLLSLPLIVLDWLYSDSDEMPEIEALIYTISFFSAIIYSVFIFVPILRSAWKYREQLGKRLWRGELHLVETYWLFGVGGGLALNILLIVLDTIYPDPDAMPGIVTVLSIFLFLFAVIYFVVIWVSIWRSAGNYKGSNQWSNLARISVIVSIAGFGLEFIAS